MSSRNVDDNCPNQTKISWISLSNIIKQGDLAKLRRSASQENIYHKFINDLKREWVSVHDYILHTKFNYEAIPGLTDENSDVNTTESMNASCSEPDTLVVTASPSWKWKAQVPKDKSAVPSKILTQNDFPYDFEDGIEHWCVWKLGSDLTEDDISWGMEELRKRGIYKDVLYWVNPINLKSLPNIDHAHIVCLRSDSDQEYVAK